MGIVIDVANPETELEDVREVFNQMLDDEVTESLHSLFQYGFGATDSIDDEEIETIIQHGIETGITSEMDTVDSFRYDLEKQREDLLSKGGEFNRMSSSLMDIIDYVLLGVNRTDAMAAQKEGIANGWNMTLTIPVL